MHSSIVNMEIIFLIGLIAVVVSVFYYRQLLLALGFLFYLPMIAYISLIQGICIVLSKYNNYLLGKGRITIWLKRLTGLNHHMLVHLEDLSKNYVEFVFGEKIMAVVIQKPGTRIEYIPLAERELPAHEQTVLIFEKQKRSKLAEERDRLVGLSDKGKVDALRSASVSFNITVMQFVGWKNVVDEEGNQVPFDSKNKETMYELLPTSIQEECEEEFGSGGTRVSEDKEAEEAEAA